LGRALDLSDAFHVRIRAGFDLAKPIGMIDRAGPVWPHLSF
jgi:hypothetical protein